jgi:hypothetical protein
MATTTSRMGSFYNEKLAGSQLRKYQVVDPIATAPRLGRASASGAGLRPNASHAATSIQ